MLSKAACEIAYEFSGARIGYKRNKISLAGIVAIQWSRILLASFYVAVIAHRLQRDHPERRSVSLEQLIEKDTAAGCSFDAANRKFFGTQRDENDGHLG